MLSPTPTFPLRSQSGRPTAVIVATPHGVWQRLDEQIWCTGTRNMMSNSRRPASAASAAVNRAARHPPAVPLPQPPPWKPATSTDEPVSQTLHDYHHPQEAPSRHAQDGVDRKGAASLVSTTVPRVSIVRPDVPSSLKRALRNAPARHRASMHALPPSAAPEDSPEVREYGCPPTRPSSAAYSNRTAAAVAVGAPSPAPAAAPAAKPPIATDGGRHPTGAPAAAPSPEAAFISRVVAPRFDERILPPRPATATILQTSRSAAVMAHAPVWHEDRSQYGPGHNSKVPKHIYRLQQRAVAASAAATSPRQNPRLRPAAAMSAPHLRSTYFQYEPQPRQSRRPGTDDVARGRALEYGALEYGRGNASTPSSTWAIDPEVRRQYLALIETGGKGVASSIQPLVKALGRAQMLSRVASSPALVKRTAGAPA